MAAHTPSGSWEQIAPIGMGTIYYDITSTTNVITTLLTYIIFLIV